MRISTFFTHCCAALCCALAGQALAIEPPGNLRATPGNGEVTLTWNATPDDPGDPVTGYRVKYRGGEFSFSGVNFDGCAASPCTIGGFTNGVEYEFRVAARAASGDIGSYTSYIPATPGIVPLPPMNVQATPGNGQAVLTWDAPLDAGSGPVTGYRVTANGDPADCTASGCTITGLANGQEYLLRVMARNTIGESQAALARIYPVWRSFTLAGGVSGSFTSGEQSCTFTLVAAQAPAASGPTAPPAGLDLPYGLVDFSLHECPGATLALTLQYPGPLPAGATYWMRDRLDQWAAFGGAAVDAQAGTLTLTLTDNRPGDSDSRNSYIAFTGGAGLMTPPVAVPGAPRNVQAEPGDGSATLRWDAPASDGGGAITGYAVTANGAATNCTAPGCTVVGLANGTAYTFAVKARNAAGDSAPATASATPRSVPGAPTGLVATPGNGEVTLVWVAPASDGGAAIGGYSVAVSPGGTCVPSPATATTCTATGLANGQEYTFTVTAANVAGSGGAASASATPAWRSFALGGIQGRFTSAEAACTFTRAVLEAPAASGPTAPPEGLALAHGLLDFALAGCASVTLHLQYPGIPAGAKYWKRNAANAWAVFDGAVVDAAAGTVTLTLTDNGPGDDDPAPGRIADPGGVGVMAQEPPPAPGGARPIPTLGAWGLLLLAALLGVLGLRGFQAKTAQNH
ncbi:fibronectin type III domain-containing protein [Acidovorax sp. YS12]|nr:fibronectin type III domain-containing protein [Comamonadaceae bacterium]UJB64672.1 fibronectin type III domain-containing protein [Acidovorax sp. YS12]